MEKMEKQVIFMDEAGFKAHLQSIEDLKERLNKLRQEKAYAYENGGDGFHDNFAFEDAERKERELLYQIGQKTEEIDRIVIVEKKEEDSIGVNDIVSLTIVSGETSTTGLYKLVSTFQLPTNEDPYMYVSLTILLVMLFQSCLPKVF